MNKRRVLIWGLVLIVLAGLLAAGLRTAEFRAGHPILQGSPQWGQPAALRLPHGWLARLLNLLPWLLLGILALGVTLALVSREFRRALLREFSLRLVAGLVLLALIGLVIGLGQLRLSQEELAEELELPELWPSGLPPHESTAPAAGETARELPVTLPWWIAYLVAMALAVPLVWWGWQLIRQLARRHLIGAPEGLHEVAARAVGELRAGLPVEEVVIRCWVRMTECFAGRTGGAGGAPAITPRELARLLAKQGIRHEAIVELTRLFEEVRYGGKADHPRRARALAALEAIEEAYGTA